MAISLRRGLPAIAGRVLVWLVILGAAGVVGLAVIVPRVAGATPYTVLTGSMTPALPPGTLVVVEPVEAAEVGVGDVITYQLESGRPAVATHRVVAQGLGEDGPIFQTQGDANDTPDSAWVRPVQVRGTLWYSVPYLGYLSEAITGQQRRVAVSVVATGLIGYAGLMFVGAARDRRSARKEAGVR